MKTAIVTAGEELTVDDVDALSDEVVEIWRQKPYPKLRQNAPEEWNVLVAIKYLYDLGVPAFSKLVARVYREVLDGQRAMFEAAVRGLVDRQWLTVAGDATVGREVRYEVHDTQLDAIQPHVQHQSQELSAELEGAVTRSVPENDAAAIQGEIGNGFYKADEYELAEKHWNLSLNLEPLAPIHYNYAIFLQIKLEDAQRAESHYKTALEVDPEYTEAHYNYAVLLENELEEPEQAAAHYETALKLDPMFPEAHYNYANLLKNNFEEPEQAAAHYETALELNPEYIKAHSNYATLLQDKLGEPEQAASHYETALELDPTFTEAHYNYAQLLKNELGEPQQAINHFTSAFDQWFDSGDRLSVRRAFARLGPFAQFCRSQDSPEVAAEYLSTGIEIAENATDPQLQQYERPLKAAYALLPIQSPTDRLSELYTYGISALCSEGTEFAVELLTEAWTLRDELAPEEYPRVAAAGVWCVVLPDADPDSDAVREASDALDEFSPVVSGLATTLFTDETIVPLQIRQNHSLQNDRHRLELRAWETLLESA